MALGKFNLYFLMYFKQRCIQDVALLIKENQYFRLYYL